MAVYWELKKTKNPVVDLSLLKDRNFSVAAFFMFMVGVVLLGSTVLIPQFLQLVMGYSATDAGEVISPGGFLIIVMLPFVGKLLGVVEARWMIGIGLAITAFSMFHMTTFNTEMDYKYVMLARCLQAAGLAFLFVPINTAAYAFVPRNKNNAASGLINLARNVGGSVGISLVITILSHRTQFHQARLVEQTTRLNPQFNAALKATVGVFGSGGGGNGPYALLMGQIQRQAATLAYVDCFWLFGIAFTVLVPFVFVMKRVAPGTGPGGH
jgi:DHA2 family multidrug resistance protein